MSIEPGGAIPSDHRVDTYPPDARLVRSILPMIPIGRALFLAGSVLVAFVVAFTIGALTVEL